MTNPITQGLLPEGLRDRLPPQAEAAANLLRGLLDCVASHGYERVQPPLVEFEDSLIGRLGSARRQDLLRFIDPVSGANLALRHDMTGQVGRIAATRLAHYTRPLRLAYGGPVLRVRGDQLRPEREALQAGAELIGRDSVAAVAEVLRLAVEALHSAGLTGLTVDITLPEFVAELAAGPWPLEAMQLAEAQRLLDAKDVAGLRTLGATRYEALIDAAGPADAAFAKLRALGLGGRLAVMLDDAAAVVATLGGTPATLDPTERHGFEFQRWIGFSIFAAGVRGEVGRGGAYTIVHPDGHEEPAVGFSLYVDGLVDAGLGEVKHRRILLPLGTPAEVGATLRAEGWATVAALEPAPEPGAFRCTHVWNGVEAVAA
jgi:ATP phosphoribosyltransferase regulatory subunit